MKHLFAVPLLVIVLAALFSNFVLAQRQSAAAPATGPRLRPAPAGTPQNLYRAARMAARQRQSGKALQLLEQVVTHGFVAAKTLRNEPDFAALAGQPGWKPLLALAVRKQQRHEARFDQPLLALVKKMGQQDQQYRRVAAAADRKQGLNSPTAREAMRQQDVLDGRLIRQVDSLVAKLGYPGRSRVGEYAKTVAFLVIQHNPDAKYLPLLTAAADRGELPWTSLSLLIDRVKTEQGQPQVYGSQSLVSPTGRHQLFPIEDEANVNVRRRKIGLEPLETYLRGEGLTYRVPTATRNLNPPGLYVTPRRTEAETRETVELVGTYEALCAQLSYPAAARQLQVAGSVTLEMVIDKTGMPQNVQVVKGLGHGCDEEAVRVMRAARYTNPTGQDHEIRVRLPFSPPGKAD